MKKIPILIMFLMFMGTQLLAQNSYWILAPKKIYFPPFGNPQETSLPTSSSPEGYHGQAAQFGQNIQMDASGNILFFIVDDRIYDRNGEIITAVSDDQTVELKSYERVMYQSVFTHPISSNGAASEVIVLPDKQDCNLFHIISTGFYTSPFNVCVSYGRLRISYKADGTPTTNQAIEMQYNENVGTSGNTGAYNTMLSIDKIIGVNNFEVVDLSHHRSPALAVVDNGNSYTLFFRNVLKTYRLTIENGNITYNDYVTNIGGQAPDRYEMEAIKLSNGNYRLACVIGSVSNSLDTINILVRDIAPNGIEVAGSQKILPYKVSLFNGYARYISGLEFNADGSRLFVTHLLYNGNSTLDYWDISGSPIKTILSNDSEIGISQIEMAKDGKMYIPRQNYLARISNVNTTPTINLTAQSISSYSPTLGIFDQQVPLRILQDQIDGSNVYDNVNPSTYHATSYSVQTNEVWDGVNNPIAPGSSIINIEKELRIKEGVSATIKNIVFQFAPGARLVIENAVTGSQGAKLTLDHTTLTNMPICGKEDMWLGVEVWGNSTAAQGSLLNSVQGILQLKNNSRIENAYIGVLVSRRDETSTGEPINISHNNNYAGGVLNASNSTFFNCQNSVAFYDYNQTSVNTSRISSCDFIWDGLLKNPSVKPSIHIVIYQNNKVYVGANKFYQNTPNIYTNKLDRGMGIFAYNSPFSVASSCSVVMPFGQDCSEANTIRSEFKNLSWGVRVFNFNNNPFEVIRNEFNNCLYGVTSVYAKNQKVSRNNFNIHEDNAMKTWGIYVTSGSGYEITENYLKPYNGNNALTYGVIIDNSGETHNEVYKNTFEGLYIGSQAQGVNGKSYVPGNNNNALGLQYKCNTFKSPITNADIAVAVNSRIDYEQGRMDGNSQSDALKNAARNSFSHTNGAYDFFLSSTSQQVNYVHLADYAQTPINYTITSPAAVYPYMQIWNGTPLYYNQEACPTKYPASWWPPIIVFPFGKSAQIDSLVKIIDNNETANLLNNIATAPNETYTYNKLMDASPYLSDEVLLAYINSAVKDVTLKSVLIENSKLSDTVYNALKASNRSNALKYDIGQYQTGVSSMKKLVDIINIKEETLQIEQQAYIHSIIDDTSIVAINDSLIKYLELCRGLEFQKQLLNVYSTTQNQHKFDSLIVKLPISRDLMSYYRVIYDLNKYNDWSVAVQEDTTIIARLNNLRHSSDPEVENITSMLVSTLEKQPVSLIVMPLSSSSRSLITSMPTEENILNEESENILLYPNPAKDELFIKFINKSDAKETIVRFYDLTGKEVLKTQVNEQQNSIINLNGLNKGIYLVKLFSDGQLQETHKLVIQ